MNRAVGEYDLYTMAPDGSDTRQLSNLPGLETDPIWSPDAKAVAFVGTRDSSDPADCTSGYVEFRCNFEIYRINADGSDLVRLTNSQNVDRTPDWSPDGSQIVYSSRKVGYPLGHLYIMQGDGSNPHAITGGPYNDETPRWSPDGTHIAFTRSTDVDTQVWIAAADGSEATQISHDSGSAAHPAWSPDGTQIAVITLGQTDDFGQIELLNVDGSNPRIIPNVRVAAGYAPAWAPDGMSLVYVRYEPSYYNLSRTDLDGTHVEALTKYDAFYSSPAWSARTH